MYYISTVAFILITAFFIWRGYKKGIGGFVVRIISCILGYIIAILLTDPISNLLVKVDFIHGLIAYVIAGTFVLSVVIIICDVTGNKAYEKILWKKPINESTYVALKVGGGLLGILLGCFFGFITSYLISFQTGQLYPESVVTEIVLETQEAQNHDEPNQDIMNLR